MMRRKHTPQLQIDNASKIKADELINTCEKISSWCQVQKRKEEKRKEKKK